MQPESGDINRQGRFADYLRHLVLEVAQQNPHQREKLSPHTQRFLDSLNEYLLSEQAAPISDGEISDIPYEFARRLADRLDTRALCQEPTPFTHGDDLRARLHSRSRNQSLADFMKAVYEHYQAEQRGAAEPPETLKVWKYSRRLDAQGKPQEHLEPVERIDFSEQSVIGFNGVLGMHHARLAHIGFARQIEQLLGGSDLYQQAMGGKPVTIYVVSYPDAHRTRYAQEVPASNANPEGYISPMMQDFTDRVLLPSLQLQAHLPLTELKAQMRKLNLFLYSYGSTLGKEMRNALALRLGEQGYTPAEIAQGFAEVYSLNIHPVCRLDDAHSCGCFSSMYLVSQHDVMAGARADYVQYVPADAKPPTLIPISDNELMVWADNPVEGIVLNEQGKLELSQRDASGEWQMKRVPNPEHGGKAGHQLQLATEKLGYVSPVGPAISDPTFMANALRHAVTKQAMPDDLVDWLAPIRIRHPKGDATQLPPPIAHSHRMDEAIRRYKENGDERSPDQP